MSLDRSRQLAEFLIGEYLDRRVRAAHEPPGVREAVTSSLIDRLDGIQRRILEQFDQLSSPSSRRVPDAYFHDEEEVESALQRAAAGIRSALALEGHLADDPREFEARYAAVLAPTAQWSVLSEASRVPRPTTRARALHWSLAPIAWQGNESHWPPTGALDLESTRYLTGADAEPARVAEPPYAGWVQIGLLERQRTVPTRHPDTPGREVVIASGLEVSGGTAPANPIPLSDEPPYAWMFPAHRIAEGVDADAAMRALSGTDGPLASHATYGGLLGAPNWRRGAGLHPLALVPRLEIVALLGLRVENPAVRHCLIDDKGPALVSRLWRGFLIHDGNYGALEPAVQGSDLIIRPDLYDHVVRAIGQDRIRSGIAVMHREKTGDDYDDDDDRGTD